jgi:hypothetical protein
MPETGQCPISITRIAAKLRVSYNTIAIVVMFFKCSSPGMSMIYSYLNLAGSLIARSCRY